MTLFHLDTQRSTDLTTRVRCIHTSCPRIRSPPSRWWLYGRRSTKPECFRTSGEPTLPATRDPHGYTNTGTQTEFIILFTFFILQFLLPHTNLLNRIIVTECILCIYVMWLLNHSVSPSEVCYQYLPSVSDIEDLYGAVRGAGGESSTVVVHLGIVLKQTSRPEVRQ